MTRYRKIMAVIFPRKEYEEVIRRAVLMAREHGAELVLGMPFDFHGGFAGDHYPFLTPQELHQQTERQARKNLEPLLAKLGAAEVPCRLLGGECNQAVSAFAQTWGAEVIVADAALSRRIRGQGLFGPWFPRPLPCEILVVQPPPTLSWGTQIASLFER